MKNFQNCLFLSTLQKTLTFAISFSHKPVHEDSLVGVLEGEVQCLGCEVADDVGQVSAPERSEALLLGHTNQHIHDALVSLVLGNGGGRVLDLKN